MKKFLFSLFLICCLFSTQISTPISEINLVQSVSASDFLKGMDVTEDGKFKPGNVNNADEKLDQGKVLNKYKDVMLFITGILTISSMAALLFQISKFAVSGSNEQLRHRAIMGILASGLGLALTGSATIVIIFFWNALA